MERGGQEGNKNAEKWTEEKLLEVGNNLLEWLEKPNNYFFEQFLLDYDLYGTFLANYVDKFNSFSKLIRKAKKKQEFKLAQAGIMGDTIASMTKFVLTNHHDYKDRVESNNNHSINSKDISDIFPEELNEENKPES